MVKKKKFLLYIKEREEMINKRLVRAFLMCLLCIALILTDCPVVVYADENMENVFPMEDLPTGGEVSASNIRTVEDVISQIKFANRGNGHSFAAEQGNNFIDKIKGKNTIVVGDDNAKNGADRLIISRDGTVISI